MWFARLFSAFALTGTAGWSQCPDLVWQRGIQLQRSGDLPAAAEAYRDCVAKDGARYDARSNLGAVLVALGRYTEAIEQYREAIASAPPEFHARLGRNLALAYYKSGQLGDALKILVPLASEQRDPNTDLLIADSYLQLGEPERAIEMLGKYEGAVPSSPAVAYVLGTALIQTGQVARGQKMIDFILKQGDSAEARMLVGVAMFTAGDLPGAVKEFASAVDLDPKLRTLHSYYGQALLSTGDAEGAAAAFRSELVRNPNDYQSNLRLGEILLQRRRFADAQPLLEKAAQLRPQELESQLDLAALALGRREYSQAATILKLFIAKRPDVAAAHAKLAEAYRGMGQDQDARTEERAAAASGTVVKVDEDGGPRVGDRAPAFVLPEVNSPQTISLEGFGEGKPVVLLFGSYTCPNFRTQAPDLNALHAKYSRKVRFLLVYIKEAHTEATWDSTINQREAIDWKPATNGKEMQAHAATCIRKLKMPFPAVVDDVDGRVETKYEAWPSRLYVVGSDGRVAYRTRLSALDFHPADVESAIQRAMAAKNGSSATARSR